MSDNQRGRAVIRRSFKRESKNRANEPVVVQRQEWAVVDPPIFSETPSFVENLLGHCT